jgi:hypothetical protein
MSAKLREKQDAEDRRLAKAERRREFGYQQDEQRLECGPFYDTKLLKRRGKPGMKRYARDGWPRRSSGGFQSLQRRSRGWHSTLSRMNGVVGIGRPGTRLRCKLICAIKLL